MRPRERRESGKQDLFRSRLDQIIDMNHALVKLARTIDWRFLEEKFGAVYTDKPGQPPLPTRLMAGLAILKHTYDLSDEALCDRLVENPYFQYFCGEEFFQHALVFDRSSLTRWRQRMGEEKLQALLQESLAVAPRTEAMKPSDLARVVIDTTVQPKAVMFPTDAKLLNRARERLVRSPMPQRCPAILMTRHARHRHSTDASAHRQHPRSLHHRCRLSRPQRPARLQVLYTTGQKRRLTPQIKHEFKRRAAIEPVIGHLKEHHRMRRNHLAHASGDAINAVLAATGYNFRRLLAWLRFLLLTILIALGLAA